ncbi:MAG: hypothetical protein J7M13_08405 [Synergistetes bacterium]|nr:hypothetical protein [Synergistota bacterium]
MRKYFYGLLSLLFLGIFLAGCGAGGGAGGGDQAKIVLDELASAFEEGVDQVRAITDTQNFKMYGNGWDDEEEYLNKFYSALEEAGLSLEAYMYPDFSEYIGDELAVKTFDYYYITDGTRRRLFTDWLGTSIYYFRKSVGAQGEEKWLWEGNKHDFYGWFRIEYTVRIPFSFETMEPYYDGMGIEMEYYNGKPYYKVWIESCVWNYEEQRGDPVSIELQTDDGFSFIVWNDGEISEEGDQISVGNEGVCILLSQGEVLDKTWLKITDLNDSSKVFYKKLLTVEKVTQISGVNPFEVVPYIELSVSNGMVESIRITFKEHKDGELKDISMESVPYCRFQVGYWDQNDEAFEGPWYSWYENGEGDPDFTNAFKSEFVWDLENPVSLNNLGGIRVGCYIGSQICINFDFRFQ